MYDYNTESITMLLQQVDYAFGGVAGLWNCEIDTGRDETQLPPKLRA
jgi:hypothetical protein